jgi:transposase
MKRFVEGEDRRQAYLLPESLDDYVSEDNPVRVVEVFIDELDLGRWGSRACQPAATGRPAYHPVDDVEAVSLRLPQPPAVEPPAGA